MPGVMGMHWGQRNYQYDDGSYKPGAEGRYSRWNRISSGGKKVVIRKSSSKNVNTINKKEKTKQQTKQHNKVDSLTAKAIDNAGNKIVNEIKKYNVNGKQVSAIVLSAIGAAAATTVTATVTPMVMATGRNAVLQGIKTLNEKGILKKLVIK